MIRYHDLYRDFLIARGGLTLNSVGCYIGYLESVSLWLEADITPELIRDKKAIREIKKELVKMGADPHTNNYKTAMGHYLQMAEAHDLSDLWLSLRAEKSLRRLEQRAKKEESQTTDTPPMRESDSATGSNPILAEMSGAKAHAEARRRAEESEIPVATAMCYAKITWQGSKQVWWFDLPVDKTEGKGKVTLLLYDQRIDKLHCLQVPKNYFGKNLNPEKTSDDRFKFRPHLSTDGLFCNKRKKCGGDISFKKFPRREC